jgi:FKBP-type peptidyl-prolyl cis-trans isomerase FkpA
MLKMKNTFFAIGFIALFAGCLKKDDTCTYTIGDPKASANEITNIQAYLAANSITATQHPTGIFYEITSAGTGASIKDQCNAVGVNYTGRLTNGSIFDATTSPVYFNLYNLIMGWRVGIPLIKVGGKIKLYLPPSFGYGDRVINGGPPYNVTIPANSILVFEIELVSVS